MNISHIDYSVVNKPSRGLKLNNMLYVREAKKILSLFINYFIITQFFLNIILNVCYQGLGNEETST